MLKHVILHLARCPDYPAGSELHGYDLVAPLDADGHLDAEEWARQRARCRVRRFRAGEPDRIGQLVHRAGGAGGATWLIDYDVERADDDEPAYRLDRHRLAEGEYVSIRDEDDDRTYRVARVQAA